MKKAAILSASMVLVVLFLQLALSAQDPGQTLNITVKSKQVNNGVVILAVQEGKNAFELQCNKGVSGCTILEPGDYTMVRLPKNRGLYDCANAEVYQQKAANADHGEILGQYCLVDTK